MDAEVISVVLKPFFVSQPVFYPDDDTGAAVHYQVCPLVDELYVVERCLREEG